MTVVRDAAVGRASRWAGVAGIVCAAHCILSPLLVLALPFLAVGPDLEVWAWLAVAVVAVPVGAAGWARHRSAAVPLALAAGLILWGASLYGLLEPTPEPVASGGGSLLTAGALLWNGRLTRHSAGDAH